jgi:hypothetical protein
LISKQQSLRGYTEIDDLSPMILNDFIFFMVFRDKEMPVDGAVNLAAFMDYVKGM